MKTSILRICCAFLLFGLVLAGSMGLIGAVTKQEALPTEEEEHILWTKVRLTAEPGCKEVRVYHADGLLMQTLLPNAAGEGVISLAVPGSYYAVFAQGCTEFSIDETLALTVIGGCGWLEGQQLHLSKEPYGTVSIARSINKKQQSPWVEYKLVDGDKVIVKTVRCPKAGRTLTCQLEGVAYGEYTLKENDVFKCRVTVNAQQPRVSISLH